MINVSPTLSTIQLRCSVSPKDVMAIREIVTATGFFRDDEIEIAVELVEERLARGPESGYEFVFAEDTSRTIGYCCYGQIPGTLDSYDIYWIAVHPSLQSRGLGRCLLERTEQEVRKLQGKRIYIETSGNPQYTPTREFYGRCGFHIEATLRDFYTKGDDKVIFCKVLLK